MSPNNLIHVRARLFVASRHDRGVATRYLELRAQGVTARVALRTAVRNIQACAAARFHEVCARPDAQIVFTRFGDVQVKIAGSVVAVMIPYGDSCRHYIDAAA